MGQQQDRCLKGNLENHLSCCLICHGAQIEFIITERNNNNKENAVSHCEVQGSRVDKRSPKVKFLIPTFSISADRSANFTQIVLKIFSAQLICPLPESFRSWKCNMALYLAAFLMPLWTDMDLSGRVKGEFAHPANKGC